MKKNNLVLLFAAMFMVTSSAIAAEAKKGSAPAASPSAHSSRNYGMAGCGLGSIVIGKGGSQITAATTNGTSFSQPFGITSGTSNCDAGANPGNTASVTIFVAANREAIQKDISRGSGETVSTLSRLMECDNPQLLGRTLQSNFGSVFSEQNASAETISANMMQTVRQNSELAKSCKSAS